MFKINDIVFIKNIQIFSTLLLPLHLLVKTRTQYQMSGKVLISIKALTRKLIKKCSLSEIKTILNQILQ